MCKYLFINSFNFFLENIYKRENYFIYELFVKYSTFLSMEHLLMSDRLFATWMTRKSCLFYSHTNCISWNTRIPIQISIGCKK